MKKASLKWVLSATVAAAMLAACGGGGSDVVPATPTTTATITAANSAALAGSPYVFDSGVAQFGTTASTSLTIAGAGAATTFSASSGGLTASGPMTFGSCIFTVTASSFPATHALGVGKVVTINPCTLKVNSAGYPTGTQSIPTLLTLGSVVSAANNKTVTVTATGTVIGTVVVTGSGS